MIRRAATALTALCLFACDRPAEAPAQTGGPAPAAEPRPAAPATESPTLRAIRARGGLNCGVHVGLPGFAYPDTRGVWRGFDADLCRAIAAAALGDGDRVRFVRLRNDQRVPALVDGRVDVVMRNVTWTLARDGGEGVDFAGVSYYDGQGFLVRRALDLQSATELSGAAICVQTGTTNGANLADWAAEAGLQYRAVPVRDEGDGRARLQEEQCDALAGDVSALAASRTVLNNPGGYVLLPEVISREPLGPMVREGDSGWADVVRWTMNVLVLAEQVGVTQRAAASVEDDDPPARDAEARRLLQGGPGAGRALGLDDDWAVRVIREVGNYGELFERNLGARSPLRLQRGLNALWNAPQPGLHYPLPMGEIAPSAAAPASTAPRP